MAFSIWNWIMGKKDQPTQTQEITSEEFLCAAEQFYARSLAFQTCANMIANAISKCEFKTFSRGRETKGMEYYLWNVEPNINQNSTEFLHSLVLHLLTKNEALVIPVRQNKIDHLVIADSWECPDREVRQDKIYQQVTVNGFTYNKTFHEDEVLHFRLNHYDINSALGGLYAAYQTLMDAAQKDYVWGAGHHMKVHVNQIAAGEKDFKERFATRIEKQVKPFMDNPNACLPEFDGYEYSLMGEKSGDAKSDTRDIRKLYDDVLDATAQAFGIPPVLLTGTVADSKDSLNRWLTDCIDPICDQLTEEITRKRYGFEAWQRGDFLRVDTSTIIHFDLFSNATSVEKLIGSGCYSINDVLTASGQTALPFDWADKHWLTLNISTVERSTASLEESMEGGKET